MTTLDAFYRDEQSTIIGSAIHDMETRMDEIEKQVFCHNGILAAKLDERKLTSLAVRFLNLTYALAIYRVS